MLTLPVHRLIPFSNVEGIGNRTSIFVQGCNANCLYCHNSETIPMKARGVMRYTVDELVLLIQANMPFIRGITVSGGEATLYNKYLIKLFKAVHRLGMTCYIDTNGFFDINQLMPCIDETDKFLYDIKGIGNTLTRLCFTELDGSGEGVNLKYHKRFSENQEHLNNLKVLLRLNKIEEVRLVYIKGFYDIHSVIDTLSSILKPYPQVPFKLIRVHGRGLPKERAYHLKGAVPSKKEMAEAESYASEKGIRKIIPIL